MFQVKNDVDQLIPDYSTPFQMKQLLEQPTSPDYPAVLTCYDYKVVWKLIDQGEDVSDYLDNKNLKD